MICKRCEDLQRAFSAADAAGDRAKALETMAAINHHKFHECKKYQWAHKRNWVHYNRVQAVRG